MKKLFLFIAILLVGYVHLVSAAIYKKVEENGRVTYTNIPTKGAQKLDLEDTTPINTGRSSSGKTLILPANNTTPSNFPNVDSNTQTQRDGKRKEILVQELNAERKALEEAKRAYEDGESNPEMFTAANGKRFRNVPKFEDKMQKLEADVKAHERNVKLLEKELAAAK